MIETLLVGDSFTALNCCNFKGQGPRTVRNFGGRWFLTIVSKAGVIYLEDNGGWYMRLTQEGRLDIL